MISISQIISQQSIQNRKIQLTPKRYFFNQQFIGSIMCLCTFVAFTSLYATLVCIACSQLEKLSANLLGIRQKLDTSEQDSGAETDREEEGLVQTSQEVFCRMQEQLNDCIRHHQQTLEYGHYFNQIMSRPFLFIIFIFLLLVGWN
jgi:hypothetical protein